MLRNPELWQQEHRRCRHGKYSSVNGNKSSEKGCQIRYSHRDARKIAHYMLAADSPTCRVPYDEVMTLVDIVKKHWEYSSSFNNTAQVYIVLYNISHNTEFMENMAKYIECRNGMPTNVVQVMYDLLDQAENLALKEALWVADTVLKELESGDSYWATSGR